MLKNEKQKAQEEYVQNVADNVKDELEDRSPIETVFKFCLKEGLLKF